MQEIWKDIPDFKGYQVSNLGNVRTHNKITCNKRYRVRHWKDRILQPKTKNGKHVCFPGYQVDLWKDGKAYRFLVARLVAFTFYNKDINDHGLTVNHIDGNRLNNTIENLELISLKENIQHGFRTGLYNFQIKVKIEDKTTGSIFYPSSLSEGCKFLNKNHSYLSSKIKRNIYEDDKYKWELL